MEKTYSEPNSGAFSTRYFRKTRTPFSVTALTRELVTTSRESTDQEFAAFQSEWMKKYAPEFDADALSVVFCQMDGNQMIAGAQNSVYLNMRRSELDVYRRVQHLDVIRPTIMRNIGTGIFNTDFHTLDVWREQPMYQEYYEPLGLLHTVSIAYDIPFQTSLRLQFTYFKEIGTSFPSTLTKDEVEYLSTPFYYVWAHRWGLIDEVTLEKWLLMLSGLTPTHLFLLRDLIARPRYSLPVTAQKFGMNSRMVNHFYNQVYNSALAHLSTSYKIEGNASKMVDLAQAYHFLTYVGDFRPHRKQSGT
jgi:hypothetical protein